MKFNDLKIGMTVIFPGRIDLHHMDVGKITDIDQTTNCFYIQWTKYHVYKGVYNFKRDADMFNFKVAEYSEDFSKLIGD